MTQTWMASRVRNEWTVNTPIVVGLTYRAPTGTQTYRVERVFPITDTHAVVCVMKLNGVYAGNLATHRINGTSMG